MRETFRTQCVPFQQGPAADSSGEQELQDVVLVLVYGSLGESGNAKAKDTALSMNVYELGSHRVQVNNAPML